MGNDGLSLDVSELGEAGALVRPRGDLSIVTAPKLAARVGQLVGRGRTRIAIDLREVVFLDSSGLGFLLNSRRRATQAGGTVVLVVPVDGQVRRVFELTRLERAFDLAPDVDEALRALGVAD